MDHLILLEQLLGPTDRHQKLEAARALAPFTGDSRVMDALCGAAVSTASHQLREVLVEALKSNPAGACMRFSDYARWSAIPSCRQWALVNLSLMACREAKAAVLQGLDDPDASVRRAAAMSTGLYDDKDVLIALERYYESHRFDLTLCFIGEGLSHLKRNPDDPDDEDVSGTRIGIMWPRPLPAG